MISARLDKSVRGALAVVLLGLSLCTWGVSPVRALDVPALTARVNDYAQLLDDAHKQSLESKLATYEQATGHQFVLLTVPTLDGDALDSFSIRAVEKWKLGAKGRDDGLLLLVAFEDRKLRIEVGYGLEGEITDAFTAGVIREVLAPAFRAGRPADGIDQSFDLLMAKGKGIAVGLPKRRSTDDLASLFPLLLFGFVGLLLLSRFFGGGGGGGGRGGRRRGGMLFLPGGFGGGGGGGFGGFGGGGGGGGFGGGGGGGFGGGGSSGSW
jgi:uncharacterized protein